jgi:hypothetical protein
MANPFEADQDDRRGLVNAAGIEAHWTDMRPRSLRAAAACRDTRG